MQLRVAWHRADTFLERVLRLRLPDSDGRVRGLIGLHNLGNTCFMASCLQCLSNIPPLTVYMCRRLYQSELNGRSHTKGRMVSAYGELVQRLWREGGSGAERPSDVKAVVGKVWFPVSCSWPVCVFVCLCIGVSVSVSVFVSAGGIAVSRL